MRHHKSKSLCYSNDNCQITLGNELKTCIFSCISMTIVLHDTVNFGGYMWRCIGAVTGNDNTYFRIGNKWFKSDEYKEINVKEIQNVIVAIYDRSNFARL